MPVAARGARLALAAALAAVTGSFAPAFAEPHSGVDGHLYRQPIDASGIFSIDGAQTPEQYDLALRVGADFGLKTLRVTVPGIGDDGADPVLSFALGLHMTVGFALTDRLTLAIDAGLYRTETDDGYGRRGRYAGAESQPSTGLISLRPLSNLDPSGGFESHGLSGPLDARVGLKAHVIDGKSLDIALLAVASVPFGDDEMFLGDSDFVLTPRLAVEYALDAARQNRILFNAGANIRRRTVLMALDPGQPMASVDDARAVLDIGSELTIGAGFTYQKWTRLGFAAEASVFVPLPKSWSYGTCSLADGKPCSRLTGSMYVPGTDYGDLAACANAGVQFRASRETVLQLGLGGTILGARGGQARSLFAVLWTPLPKGVETPTSGDSDGDGNPDFSDVCPDETEDADGFQDDDGCPELDNDGDGLLDVSDTCPDQPEDKDGHRDGDGCPDPDNDGDGILDVADRCIAEAEDFDGFEDDDGCPERDNDNDGIADDKDKCPVEPETKNGVADDDGCPDAQTQTGPVEVLDRIDLRGNRITFVRPGSAKLTGASQVVLQQVAAIVIRKSLRIRIEVHVPLSTRSRRARTIARARAADKRLAQRRAEAILDHLVRQQGVPLPALQAVGIGSVRPIQTPPTREVNARVDFIKREQRQP